jgi:hypothetical protein
MNYQLVKKSHNSKTGEIPVSTSAAETCPSACPFKANGCYAEAGFYTNLNWKKVTTGERGKDWQSFLEDVRSIADGQLWRHNVAGDLPGKDNAINGKALGELAAANTGKRGFTYTHKPMDTATNRDAVKLANENGFTVNLSANTLAHADELKDLGIAPVVVVVAHDAPAKLATPKGNTVVVCPAQQHEDVTCKSCGLCAIKDRKVIIGFQAHGKALKRAEAIAQGE